MAGYFTKKRNFPDKISWRDRYVSSGIQRYRSSYVDNTLRSTQVTTSYSSIDRTGVQTQREFLQDSLEGSYARQRALAGDTGHTFQSTRKSTIFDRRFKHYSTNVPNGICSFDGPLWIYEATPSLAYPAIPVIDLNYYGTAAIKNTIPNSPLAGLATFTGELHQFPQIFGAALLKNQANFFRGIGGEYLNIEFGWKPFVSDLKKAVASLLKANDTIYQMFRDNGRYVRRRFEFDPIVETGPVTLAGSSARMVPNFDGFMSPLFVAGGNDTTSKIERQTRLVRRIWFSGQYQYFLPLAVNDWGKLYQYEAIANRLLGTRITPAVLWNLTPWTWLSDWFSNLGDIISNNSALDDDNLVLRYGYLMCESTMDTTYTGYGFKFTNYDPGPLMTTYRQVSKQRIRATPYGFGLNPNSFTARQWAILSALALTKTPGSLKVD